MIQRLSIVVPYRAREEHLNQFVPHLRSYFARDKVDRATPYRVLIVEQESGLPFNRGALKNIGFKLGCDDSDYTCFHDIDYLPIWADYTWVDSPTPIVWFGAEAIPIAPGRSGEAVVHDLDEFFGGALLVPNALFARVNGYSNDYWGWGYEDEDLVRRFRAAGIATGRRKGTFMPLFHDSEGMQLGGKPTPVAAANLQILRNKWTDGTAVPSDGLSNLAFQIVSRHRLPEAPVVERPASWEVVTVRLDMRPRQN